MPEPSAESTPEEWFVFFQERNRAPLRQFKIEIARAIENAQKSHLPTMLMFAEMDMVARTLSNDFIDGIKDDVVKEKGREVRKHIIKRNEAEAKELRKEVLEGVTMVVMDSPDKVKDVHDTLKDIFGEE